MNTKPVEKPNIQNAAGEKPPKEEKKVIQIEEGKLLGILKRLEMLEKQASGEAPVLEAVKTHTARLKRFDEKLIVGYDKGIIYEKKLIEGKEQQVMMITVQFQDGTKKKIEYVKDYVQNNDIVEVKVLKTDVKDDEKRLGLVEVKRVDEYRTIGTGVKVPMRVITPIATSLIELPNGEKITINNEFLN